MGIMSPLIIWIQWSKNLRILGESSQDETLQWQLTMVFSFSFKKRPKRVLAGPLSIHGPKVLAYKKMGGDSSLSSPSFLGAAHPPVVLLVTSTRQLVKLHLPWSECESWQRCCCDGKLTVFRGCKWGSWGGSYKRGTRDFAGDWCSWGKFRWGLYFWVRWKNQRQKSMKIFGHL